MVVSNRNLLFQGSIFSGYVSFREGNLDKSDWLAGHDAAMWRKSEVKQTYSWLNQAIWKIWSSNWIISQGSGWNKLTRITYLLWKWWWIPWWFSSHGRKSKKITLKNKQEIIFGWFSWRGQPMDDNGLTNSGDTQILVDFWDNQKWIQFTMVRFRTTKFALQ